MTSHHEYSLGMLRFIFLQHWVVTVWLIVCVLFLLLLFFFFFLLLFYLFILNVFVMCCKETSLQILEQLV